MLSTEVIFCSLMIIFFCFVVNGLAVIMKTRFLIFRKCSDKNGYVCIHCSWGLDLQNGYIPAVHAIVQQGQTGLMFDIMEPISVERSESFYSQLQKIASEVHKRSVSQSVACRFANVPDEKAVSSQEDYRETVDDEDEDEDDDFVLSKITQVEEQYRRNCDVDDNGDGTDEDDEEEMLKLKERIQQKKQGQVSPKGRIDHISFSIKYFYFHSLILCSLNGQRFQP